MDSILRYDTETQWSVDFENWERERFIDNSAYENVLDAAVFETQLRYENPQGVFSLERLVSNPPCSVPKKKTWIVFITACKCKKGSMLLLKPVLPAETANCTIDGTNKRRIPD